MRTLGNTTGADLGPVCTDSRQVRQGSVFVALKGERFDGHDYAAQAARDGASVVVVERDTGASCRRSLCVILKRHWAPWREPGAASLPCR